MIKLPDIRDVANTAVIILPHIHSFDKMWYFTNHGENHCLSVLKNIEEIIKICDLSGMPLNDAEKAILRCASWLHDLGRIREEDGSDHALESVRVIRILSKNGHLNLGIINDEVEHVVATHSTKGLQRLQSIEKERPISGIQENVRLKLLCALFKIADECDIDRLRAPKPVYDILRDKMPPTSKFHWLRHNNVIKVVFSYTERKIVIHMLKGCDDEDILESLDKTLDNEIIREILAEHKFPLTEYCIQFHAKVNISEE